MIGGIMFGMGSARVRAGVVLAGFIATAALTVVVVQANASGTRRAKLAAVPKAPSSLKQAAAAAEASLRANAAPQASAIVAGSPVTVSCGERLTASTTLTANLDCAGENGLILGANGIVLNLNGHFILGSYGESDGTVGVQDTPANDTIEMGYIKGFEFGVGVNGGSSAVTKVQTTYAYAFGFFLDGGGDKATSDTAAENYGSGMYVSGGGATVQSDHLLNNEGTGLYALGGGDKLLDNTADGNTVDGIYADGELDTLTGNVANYNGELGIDAYSPTIDGGSNAAMGNGTKEQCRGVVCS